MNDMNKQIFSGDGELESTLKRYFRFLGRGDGPSIIIDHFEEQTSGRFWERILSAATQQIPNILIIEYENEKKEQYCYEEDLDFLKEVLPEFVTEVTVPFHTSRLFLHPTIIKNPFGGLHRLYYVLKQELKEDNNIQDILESNLAKFLIKAGKITGEKRIRKREQIFHQYGTKSLLFVQFVDLIAAHVKKKFLESVSNGNNTLEILLIENHPERKLEEIDVRFKGVFKNKDFSIKHALKIIGESFEGYKFYLRENEFHQLYNDLKKEAEEGIRKKYGKKEYWIGVEDLEKRKMEIPLDSLSLVLVDIHLNLKEEGFDGLEFVSLFKSYFPHVPIFILSGIDDYEAIRKAMNSGTEYYILKSQIFSLPYVYYSYIESVGNIINFISDSELKKSLIGNIRYWNFKKHLLWDGDKCYHMIDHSFNHTSDVWKIMNEILFSVLVEKGREFVLPEGEENRFLYALSMAIWLHDIGHKGTERYGEAYQIRDNHGYISAELILKNPELYGIEDDDPDGNYYKDIKFHPTHPGAAIEILYKRVRKRRKLSIAEIIALLAIFHKSNTPLTESDYYFLASNPHKFIPIDYFEGGERKADRIIYLERIVNEWEPECRKGEKKENREKLLQLASLFRLVDGLDTKRSRVGDITEMALKKNVIREDKEYEISKIRKEVENLARFCKSPSEEAVFVKVFFEMVREKIEKGEIVKMEQLESMVTDKRVLEDYILHVNYASFIAVQPGHFSLHSSIDEIEINYEGNERFQFVLITNKDKEELEKESVLERGREEETLFDRLIGKSCYVLSELNSGKRFLKNLIREVAVILQDKDGNLIGKQQWP